VRRTARGDGAEEVAPLVDEEACERGKQPGSDADERGDGARRARLPQPRVDDDERDGDDGEREVAHGEGAKVAEAGHGDAARYAEAARGATSARSPPARLTGPLARGTHAVVKTTRYVSVRGALVAGALALAGGCDDANSTAGDAGTSSSAGDGGSATIGSGAGGSGGGSDATGGNGVGTTSQTGTGGGAPSLDLAGSPCPPRFVDALVTCADARLADPSSGITSAPDAIAACGDATQLAGAFAASCADDSPTPIYCSAGVAPTWSALAEQCLADGWTAWARRTCVFGARFADAMDSPRLLVVAATTLDAGATLDADDAAQVVAALEPSGLVATTSAEAFAAVDGGSFVRTELVDRWNGRSYTSLAYAVGGATFGRFFWSGTLDDVADVIDGVVDACVAEPWPGGEACQGFLVPSTCTSPLVCVGSPPAGDGICTRTTPVASDGSPCSSAAECGPDGYCTVVGLCVSPWKTGQFDDVAFAPLVDGGALERTFVVRGLATVPVEATLDLLVREAVPSEITVTLVNPNGTAILIAEGGSLANGVAWAATPVPVPGDELANGDWTLRVEDAAGGSTGWLSHARLTLATRWD
jgi:hypothetical protein